MDNSYKLLAILAVSAAITIVIPASVQYYTSGQIAIEAVKNGLQECPVKGGSYGQTAWQKECEE